MKRKFFCNITRGIILVIVFFFAISTTNVRGQGSDLTPPRKGLEVIVEREKNKVALKYNSQVIFEGVVELRRADGVQVRESINWLSEKDSAEEKGPAIRMVTSETEGAKLEQRITFRLSGIDPNVQMFLSGLVTGTQEAIAAETLSEAQKRFPMVRNAVGVSYNLRNNAVYDRKFDWLLFGPGDGQTQITPKVDKDGKRSFSFITSGRQVELVFRPRFYQEHKNLKFFEPWKYKVWERSVTGWCSWWPYQSGFSEKDLKEVLAVFGDKRLGDYGYKYIQIDLCYQTPGGWGGTGTPASWLNWNQQFPSGMDGAVKEIKSKNLEPGIWTFPWSRDEEILKKHADWFIPDQNGQILKVPWMEHSIDMSSSTAVDTLIRPTYRAFAKEGFTYVKVDGLRHLLYDALYPSRKFYEGRQMVIEEVYRKYLEAIRGELGRDVYILGCWGVLPESIGLVDGCRLGGDGFGPRTLQQYNSWNGIVWRNDPDHCDLVPGGLGKGDVKDSIIRPVIVSMAGAVLMLTDKAEVYRDDKYLEGAKRSSPVLFTVPGQLYDYESIKTDNVAAGLRNTEGGSVSGPIDAYQQGPVCPWWLLEIDRPFERWNVLARFSWDTALDAEWVKFSDLGLAAGQEYLVYEFWTNRLMGIFKDSFPAEAQTAKNVHVYSIRTKLDRPQIISTSRHISQGGVDLAEVNWDEKTLRLFGSSDVTGADQYAITLYVPTRFEIVSAQFDDKPIKPGMKTGTVSIRFMPEKNGRISWSIEFKPNVSEGAL